MNEQFYMKMHMADTPQRQNAKQFGAGVAQNNYYTAYQMHVKMSVMLA